MTPPFHPAAPLDGATWPPPPVPLGWVAEAKLDGHRASCSPTGEVRTRGGALVGRGPAVGLWLDGEWVGRFVAFDVPCLPGPWSARRAALEGAGLEVVPILARGGEVVPALGDEIEGVVVKSQVGLYGLDPWIKYRARPAYGVPGRTTKSRRR